MLLGSIIFFISLLSASFTKNIYHFLPLFSCSMSLAVGILYMTPISICVKYYPDKKGLVCGIILGFYGLSGVII